MEEKTNDLDAKLLLELMTQGKLTGVNLKMLTNNANKQVADAAKFLLQSPKELFYAVYNMDKHERSDINTGEITEEYLKDMKFKAKTAAARLEEIAADEGVFKLMKGCDGYNSNDALFYILPFSKNDTIVRRIGSLDRTPIDVIRYLANSTSACARTGAARNAYIPEELMQVLVNDESFEVLKSLILNKSTPGYLIDKLSFHDFTRIKELVARSAKASAEALTRLLHEEEFSISVLALRNPNLPYNEVLKIVKNESSGKMFEVALMMVERNKRKTQRALIEQAAILAIQNGLLNKDELVLLSELNLKENGAMLEGDIVKSSIFYMKTNEEVFDIIVNNEALLKSVVKNSDDTCEYFRRIKNQLKYLSADEQCRLADDPKTTRELFFVLAFSNQIFVKDTLCGNESVDGKILNYLSNSEDVDIQALVAANENTPVETLSNMYQMYGSNERILEGLLENKNLPLNIRKEIEKVINLD